MEEEAEAEREEGAFLESQSKNPCQSQIAIHGLMFNWPSIPWTHTTGLCLGNREVRVRAGPAWGAVSPLDTHRGLGGTYCSAILLHFY